MPLLIPTLSWYGAGIAEIDPSDGLPALLRHPEQDLQAGVIPAQIFHVESRLHLLDADIL